MKLRVRVGLNIQELRRARGMSQEELALRAHVNRGYMGKIENARYSPSVDILERVAKALEIDPVVLFLERRRR